MPLFFSVPVSVLLSFLFLSLFSFMFFLFSFPLLVLLAPVLRNQVVFLLLINLYTMNLSSIQEISTLLICVLVFVATDEFAIWQSREPVIFDGGDQL